MTKIDPITTNESSPIPPSLDTASMSASELIVGGSATRAGDESEALQSTLPTQSPSFGPPSDPHQLRVAFPRAAEPVASMACLALESIFDRWTAQAPVELGA